MSRLLLLLLVFSLWVCTPCAGGEASATVLQVNWSQDNGLSCIPLQGDATVTYSALPPGNWQLVVDCPHPGCEADISDTTGAPLPGVQADFQPGLAAKVPVYMFELTSPGGVVVRISGSEQFDYMLMLGPQPKEHGTSATPVGGGETLYVTPASPTEQEPGLSGETVAVVLLGALLVAAAVLVCVLLRRRRLPKHRGAAAAPRALRLHAEGAPYILSVRTASGITADLGIDPGCLQAGISIGRSSACDIRVDDSQTSSHHCFIKLHNKSICLQDNNSRNGTLLNGRVLARGSRVELHHGDIITIGRSTLTFTRNH